ncbi:hypothetical protein [Sorangium sp. So ce1024]|uniref:hypothetical protein n=1 Tax=Sorangium sp. So ce1024 TaxID=3133327 RepID=UPI003F0AB3B5
MTDSIPLHPDDVETVLNHALNVAAVARDPHLPDLMYGLEDLPEEVQANWRRWVQSACAGAQARACNMGMVTWTAARGMARALAERRRSEERDEDVALGFTPEREPSSPRPAQQASPEVQAVIRRAARGLRWRSPEGEEKKALRVEALSDLVYIGGFAVGTVPHPGGPEIAWSDGTMTPAREVADPRLGWQAIQEVEG